MKKNPTVENVYTRYAAKELTRKHFWKLLGMMLVTFVIIFALGFGGAMLLTMATGATVSTTTTNYSVSAQIDPASITPAFLVGYIVLMLVISLVSCGLNLGMTRSMIDICRGDADVTVGRMFSRMGKCVKGLLLNIWVSLKIIVWALPVYALIGVAAFFLVSSAQAEAAAQSEGVYLLISFLPLLAIIAVIALVIPAAFRYMLSTHVLADQPSTGVFACVRQSKALMKGHKWQAFKLVIPMILMVYLIMIAIMIVLVIGSTVFAETSPVALAVLGMVLGLVMMVTGLIYAMRMTLAYCLFYLKRKGDVSPTPVEEEERIVCWMPNSDAQ